MEVDIFARSWVIHLQQPERRYRRLRKTQPTDGDGPPSSNTSGAASVDDAVGGDQGAVPPSGGKVCWMPWLCPDSATSVPTILNVSDDAVQATLRAIDLHHRTQEPGIHISSPDTDVDAHGMAASFSCGSRGSLNTSSALPAARQYKRPLGSGRCTFAPAVFRKFLADGQRMAVDVSAVCVHSDFTAMGHHRSSTSAPRTRSASQSREALGSGVDGCHRPCCRDVPRARRACRLPASSFRVY
ncbi:hypothetical_protein [Leishmania infantum]|uniref:Hypothetical_protein n=1 Tax=Leishmania infantum TaxID=5671 RepID=A0A6L0WIR0_LEIIN|nr:hypothetical_protein [Leishmania infantum]SUZ39352.1 hypothetical_protein [Leishmania infantum]